MIERLSPSGRLLLSDRKVALVSAGLVRFAAPSGFTNTDLMSFEDITTGNPTASSKNFEGVTWNVLAGDLWLVSVSGLYSLSLPETATAEVKLSTVAGSDEIFDLELAGSTLTGSSAVSFTYETITLGAGQNTLEDVLTLELAVTAGSCVMTNLVLSILQMRVLPV